MKFNDYEVICDNESLGIFQLKDAAELIQRDKQSVYLHSIRGTEIKGKNGKMYKVISIERQSEKEKEEELWEEWDNVCDMLKNSGVDLSKIKIVGKSVQYNK